MKVIVKPVINYCKQKAKQEKMPAPSMFHFFPQEHGHWGSDISAHSERTVSLLMEPHTNCCHFMDPESGVEGGGKGQEWKRIEYWGRMGEKVLSLPLSIPVKRDIGRDAWSRPWPKDPNKESLSGGTWVRNASLVKSLARGFWVLDCNFLQGLWCKSAVKVAACSHNACEVTPL